MTQVKLDQEKTRKKKSRRRCPKWFTQFTTGLLSFIIHTIHSIKDTLLDYVYSLYWGEKQICPPLPPTDGFLQKSAVELATMIRQKKLTSTELVTAYITRMQQVNPLLNAIVDGPFAEDAIAEAQSIDNRIMKGLITGDEFLQRPFLGVPFTTKDSTAVKGKLHTLGLVSRMLSKAKEDAECIRLIKEAGGIILATTNIPEVNKWQETRNMFIGQTNNPYDTRRTVGGSSGGEAASISSCMTGFGIGTDIGGSIRMPAFYCGIFGHKPTVGVVNTRGCTLRTGKEPSTMVVAGPMSRHATDLMPLLKVLATPESLRTLRLDEPVDLAKLKFYYVRESGEMRCSSVSQDLQMTMTKVINHFEQICDTQPVKVTLKSTEYTSRMWRYWMTQEPANFNAILGNGIKLNAFVELAKKIVGKCDYTLASIYSLFDSILPKEKEDKIKEYTRQCDEELTNLLGNDGILLYHNAPLPAPYHYTPLINIYNFSYWSLFNVLHVPATQVPMGVNAQGLPLGIQIVASRNRDRDCLAVAAELERAFGGWQAPFTSNIE